MAEGDLGTLVRTRRLAMGMTTGRLAEAAGTTSPNISQIESGKTRLPGVETRRRLAAALGLTNLDLLVAAGEISRDEASGGGEPALPAEVMTVAALANALTSEDRRAVVALLERLVGAREENRAYAAASPAPASEPVGSASG